MKKRGASLVWTILLCGILTMVISTMAMASMSELKTSGRMDSSASAYSAAKSGVEWGRNYIASKKCDIAEPCEVANQNFTLDTGITFVVNITRKTPTGSIYIVNSKGTANRVNRVLEYEIDKNEAFALQKMNNQDIVDSSNGARTYNFADNVTLVFDYWKKVNTLHDIIGFKSVSGKSILLRYDNSSDSLKIIYIDASGSETASQNNISTVSKNSPVTPNFDLNYQIKLQYVKSGVMVATAWERDSVGILHCLGSANLDLSTKDLGGVDRFRLLSSSAVVSSLGLNPIRLGAASSFYADNFYQKGLTSNSVNYTVSVAAGAGGSASASPSSVISGGFSLISATAIGGYNFSSWSGDCAGQPASFTMTGITSNKNCTANFVAAAQKPVLNDFSWNAGAKQLYLDVYSSTGVYDLYVHYRHADCNTTNPQDFYLGSISSGTRTISIPDEGHGITFTLINAGGQTGYFSTPCT